MLRKNGRTGPGLAAEAAPETPPTVSPLFFLISQTQAQPALPGQTARDTMNKNKVVKIIKLFVICLITAMFISGDCDGCKNPMKTKEGEEINKGHYFMAAMALRFVTSMTVDKNVVGAGESYKLSWEYPGTDDIIGPESAISVDYDHPLSDPR